MHAGMQWDTHLPNRRVRHMRGAEKPSMRDGSSSRNYETFALPSRSLLLKWARHLSQVCSPVEWFSKWRWRCSALVKLLSHPALLQTNFLPSTLPVTSLLLRPRGIRLELPEAIVAMAKWQYDVRKRNVQCAIEGWGRVEMYNGGPKGPRQDNFAPHSSGSERYAPNSLSGWTYPLSQPKSRSGSRLRQHAKRRGERC